MLDIVEGHLNRLLNKEQELSSTRIKICHNCKLLTNDVFLGDMCNSKIYLNVKTNEIINYPKEGYANGCGCVLQAKTRLIYSKCPLEK